MHAKQKLQKKFTNFSSFISQYSIGASTVQVMHTCDRSCLAHQSQVDARHGKCRMSPCLLLSDRSDLHAEVYKAQRLRQALGTRHAATLHSCALESTRRVQSMLLKRKHSSDESVSVKTH